MALGSFPLPARWANALLVPAALVAMAPTLNVQTEEEDTYLGESTEYYASVRVLEGEAVVRKGELEEPLSRGVPIGEGDVVESHGRGILQLADGTRVAFGSGTRFQVAALFTTQDRDRQVLLRLDYGRLRIALGRDSEARVRVDTPSGSAILADGANAGLELEQDRTVRVKVHSGRAIFLNERDRTSLVAGERLTAYSAQDRLDRIQDYNTYGGDAFDSWSARLLDVRRGPSWDKVPQELRYHSDDLDEHGEWIYVDEYRTWCWRPLGVAAEWRPYWRGRWGAYPGGMTWVSDEPWGYVTYHHGRWGWGAGLGWYWIPGVHYAPAWVAWQTSDAYFGWAPLGYHGAPAVWGFGVWGGGFCWNIVEINVIHTRHIHTRTHHDPGVIRTFNSGSGSTGWNPGSRPLTHPWRRTPVVVSPGEFRDPSRFRATVLDSNTQRSRLRTFEQHSGRPLLREPRAGTVAPPTVRGPGSSGRGSDGPRPLVRPRTESGGNPPVVIPPTARGSESGRRGSDSPRPLVRPRTESGGNPPIVVPPTTSRGPSSTFRPVPRERPIQAPSEGSRHSGRGSGSSRQERSGSSSSGSGAPVILPPPQRPLRKP